MTERWSKRWCQAPNVKIPDTGALKGNFISDCYDLAHGQWTPAFVGVTMKVMCPGL